MLRKKVLALLVVSMFFISYAHADSSYSVTVLADPIWTDTGIVLNGEKLTVYGASGTWTFGDGFFYDADGLFVTSDWEWNEWITNDQHGQLIGFVGDITNMNLYPSAVPQNDPRLFAIGTGSVTLSGLQGRLWLGINDDYTGYDISDNHGSITANVDLSPVPEPATIFLLGSGIAALTRVRLRRNKKMV